MRILFYSTSSNFYDGEKIKATTLPSWEETWEHLAENHPEHEFLIATQLPGMFLVDVEKNEIRKKSALPLKITRKIIKADCEKEIAEELCELKPDLTVALSFYVLPYDWLTVKDAVVADFLREKGIETVCHPVETSLVCFDKMRSHEFLSKIGLNVPRAVYLDHELCINAWNRRDVKSNVYRDAIFHEVKKLRYPVIIKDTTGLSSFGADVVGNYDEALGVLLSKKTTSSRIIEEMVSGGQFGTEIYGRQGSYAIFPPFKFSVNQYGITSPKQSVKIGPLSYEDQNLNEKYRLSDLRETLTRLANSLELDGIAQVDLVFDGKKWVVIEVNPRLSGMTTTYAASTGLPLSEMIFQKLKIFHSPLSTVHYPLFPTLNIKFPILDEENLSRLYSLPYVAFVNQIENHAARQIREQGYCEVILTGKTFMELKENLLDLKEKFSECAEKSFFEKAIEMIEGI